MGKLRNRPRKKLNAPNRNARQQKRLSVSSMKPQRRLSKRKQRLRKLSNRPRKKLNAPNRNARRLKRLSVSSVMPQRRLRKRRKRQRKLSVSLKRPRRLQPMRLKKLLRLRQPLTLQLQPQTRQLLPQTSHLLQLMKTLAARRRRTRRRRSEERNAPRLTLTGSESNTQTEKKLITMTDKYTFQRLVVYGRAES